MANLMNLMLGSGFLALQMCLSTAWSCDTTSSYQQYIALSTLNALNTTGHYTLHETGTMKFTRGSAFDNNPSSLYGVYEWPLLGNVSQPLAWLGPTDAWLWIGCTPPNLEYFSFRSYLFEQPNAQGWPDILFSSLGDSNNIMTVNTTAGGPCNRTVAVITTADMVTAADISAALVAQGFPKEAINIDVVPASVLELGRDISDDLFVFLYRVALFNNATEGEMYTNNTWPVYFIYGPDRTPSPYPMPQLRNRGNDSNIYLESYMQTTSNSIISLYESLGATLLTTQRGMPFIIEGFQCIADKTDCIGDNRDAAYVIGNGTFTLPDYSTFIVIVGANHAASLDCVYASLAVDEVEFSDGLVSVNNEAFEGSVQHFAPNSQNADLMYAYVIARNCSAIPKAAPFCLEISDSQVSLPDSMQILERAYLHRSTRVGPNTDLLAMPYLALMAFV